MARRVVSSGLPRFALGQALGLALMVWLAGLRGARLGDQLSTFSTVFLGIFIEAAPFLLLGTLASGLVEVFVSPELLRRRIPSGALGGALAGTALGFLFPVCECGTVPLARRLFRKGLPVSAGVAFLLAAPVVNPIVLASTAAAFRFGPLLAWRFALAFLGTFSPGSVLAFLVYGPMVDLKSILMFRQVFKRRGLLYLVLIPLVLTIAVTVTMNLFQTP